MWVGASVHTTPALALAPESVRSVTLSPVKTPDLPLSYRHLGPWISSCLGTLGSSATAIGSKDIACYVKSTDIDFSTNTDPQNASSVALGGLHQLPLGLASPTSANKAGSQYISCSIFDTHYPHAGPSPTNTPVSIPDSPPIQMYTSSLCLSFGNTASPETWSSKVHLDATP